MTVKLIGALCILAGCAGVGFQISANFVKEEKSIRQLISLLDYMSSELQYRLTALPDLCRQASLEAKGPLSRLFLQLSNEMSDQVAPDVSRCMAAALAKVNDIPPITCQLLQILGSSLGRFDMSGQLRGIDCVRAECKRRLDSLTENKDVRLRSYKTLGLCAGAAIVILFI